ncbi:MAG TPA: hypothetical protein VKP65_22010 [Rhodothermales bacterium]|nr:hypothetical protein [Rhodothermales bacterium]
MKKFVKHFLRNIELWLSGAGLLVVWVAYMIVSPASGDVWKIAAITALVVSVLHGIIFWVVRSRQRRVRAQAIHEIREMLGDVVKNQLAVIGMWLPEDKKEYGMHIEGIQESMGRIEELVDSMSEEALASWKDQYAEAIESTGAMEYRQAA